MDKKVSRNGQKWIIFFRTKALIHEHKIRNNRNIERWYRERKKGDNERMNEMKIIKIKKTMEIVRPNNTQHNGFFFWMGMHNACAAARTTHRPHHTTVFTVRIVYFGDFLVFHQHQHMIHGSICAYVQIQHSFFFSICIYWLGHSSYGIWVFCLSFSLRLNIDKWHIKW